MIVIVMLLVAVVFVAGCVSRTTYDKVVEERDKLKSDNTKLNEEIATLKPPEEEEEPPEEFQKMTNPITATPESIAAGKALFESTCWVCHGKDGRGDGPAAANLNPKPIDFTTDKDFAVDTDGIILWHTFENGVPGTAMPAFKGFLTEDDVWNIINYERTFLPK
jgi:mono/diheme cytochrome c family protein